VWVAQAGRRRHDGPVRDLPRAKDDAHAATTDDLRQLEAGRGAIAQRSQLHFLDRGRGIEVA
jgi:hypothetical protein